MIVFGICRSVDKKQISNWHNRPNKPGKCCTKIKPGLDLAGVVDVKEGARVDRGVEPFSALLLQLLLPMLRPVSVVAKEVSFAPAKLP